MVISFFHFVDVIARLVVVKRGFTSYSLQLENRNLQYSSVPIIRPGH